MMLRVIVSVLILTGFNSACQTKESDTAYFSSGKIKSVRYSLNERHVSAIRYFKSSENLLDQNEPLVDTVYNNHLNGVKDWKHYDGSVLIFLPGNANLYIKKHTQYGYGRDSVFYKVKGVYAFLFKEAGNLQVEMEYDKDTSIKYLGIHTVNTNKPGFPIVNSFFLNRYQKGFKADTGNYNFMYTCGDVGSIELRFWPTHLLKAFILYPKDKTKNALIYEFYPNFFCKRYGSLAGEFPTGRWIEYYPNGNIKSIGSYKEDSLHKAAYISTGTWEYYTEKGKLLRTEHYDSSGKLIKNK